MSHEVRTPLNAIVGFSQLMTYSSHKPEKIKEYAEAISTSSDNLIEIITNLIEISEITANTLQAIFTDFNVVDLINHLGSKFDQLAKIKKLNFMLDMNIPNKKYFILSDIDKLKKIISYIIDNAIKFTHQGSVIVTCAIEQERLHLTIIDSGIGIDTELQKTIFEPFRQLDTGASRKYGGNGLGLSIVKAYIELLNGTISLKSEIDVGTEVSITIPVNKKDNLTSQKIHFEQKYFINTILIAEDDLNNFKYLRDLLDGLDIKILHAVNGKQAFEMCKTDNKIDLIMMDIEMPIMDGHTATKLIKELRPDLPIIAQTAYALDSEKAKYQDAFDDYITKPIRRKELKEKLQNFIQIEN